MILFVCLVFILVVFGLRIRKEEEYNLILSRQDTMIINAIFAILILLSHSTQYYVLSSSKIDSIYAHFQSFHNQWVVTTFLAFSGYGVMKQIMQGGEDYLSRYPKNRFLKTLIHFDFAIVLFICADFVLGISYSAKDVVGSFIGITSVGNSNWYMFDILVLYIFSYIVAILFRKDFMKQAVAVTVLVLAFIATLYFFRMPSRFYSTVGCYALGVWIAIYKDQVVLWIQKRKIISILCFGIVIVATYKFRYIDIVMNINSIAFVMAVVWANVFFRIQSKVLLFVGKHAFGVFILQRIPMMFLSRIPFFVHHIYLFVLCSFIGTCLFAIMFDQAMNRMDQKFFQS